MAWQLMGNFLAKFSKIKPPKKIIQDDVIEIVNKIVGVKMELQDVVVNNSAVFLKIKNQPLKNEIFIKKEKILNSLKERLGEKINDLRF